MPLHCGDCGQEFEHAHGHGSCQLCIKRDAAASKTYGSLQERDEALKAVEEEGQCGGCGKCYKYLKLPCCGQCKNLDDVKMTQKDCKKGKEHKQSIPEIISINDSDQENDGASSDVQVLPGPSAPFAALRESVNKHKATASTIRLSTKSDTIHEKTKKYLTAKKNAHAATATPSKSAAVLFWCDLYLINQTGKKTGTRVPGQTRGFQPTEILSDVFAKFVKMFNESDGEWVKNYPGKLIQSKGPNAVNFVFKSGVAIPAKYRAKSVGAFWDAFSATANTSFKPADIAHRTATITILVPEETVALDSDSDEEEEFTRKRKRTKQKSSERVKREKVTVKEEVMDGSVRVKADPDRDTISSSKSVVPPLSIPLKRSITYIKQYCSTELEIDSLQTVFEGKLGVVPVPTPLLPRTFELTDNLGSLCYLARRMDGFGITLTSDAELAAGHAELIRGMWLKEVLHAFFDRAKRIDIQVESISSPDLFVALIQSDRHSRSGTNSNLLVCQPYVKPETLVSSLNHPAILDTLSHFSLIHFRGDKVLIDFKMSRNNSGDTDIFAPLTHSSTTDSGLGDGGPEAINEFWQLHICNELCVLLNLPANNSYC